MIKYIKKSLYLLFISTIYTGASHAEKIKLYRYSDKNQNNKQIIDENKKDHAIEFGTFKNSTLTNCNMSRSYFHYTRLGQMVIRDSDFKNTTFKGRGPKGGQIYNTSFANAYFIGEFILPLRLNNIAFHESSLHKSQFKRVSMPNAQFLNLDMADARLTHVNLEDAYFENVNLTDALFLSVKLKGARFKNVNFRGAIFSRTSLKGAEIYDDELNDFRKLKKKDLKNAGAKMNVISGRRH